MYHDFQALNVTALQGGQKTATEINAAYQPFDNKVDQFEYCVIEFLQGLFRLIGIQDQPSFKRSRIVNQLEETQMVLMAANYLDDETILNHLPWLTPDEVQEILRRKDAENMQRLDVMDTLEEGREAPEVADYDESGQRAPANR